MKTKYIIAFAACLVLFTACHKPGTVQVKNDISGVEIRDVRWGDIYLAGELLPGQSSDKYTVDWFTDDLPATYKVSFVMTANNQQVYLETTEEFTLDEDDELLIVLDDKTKVKN